MPGDEVQQMDPSTFNSFNLFLTDCHSFWFLPDYMYLNSTVIKSISLIIQSVSTHWCLPLIVLLAGTLADAPEKKEVVNPNPKKRSISTSLWRTGLQKQTKEEILEEAERILEQDRMNAQGPSLFIIFLNVYYRLTLLSFVELLLLCLHGLLPTY